MLGVFPACFKLDRSEADCEGKRDYIVEQSTLELPIEDSVSFSAQTVEPKQKLQDRKQSFLDKLMRIIEEKEKHSCMFDVLCLENSQSSNIQEKFSLEDLPKVELPSLKSFEKKESAKKVT